jgi:hypothetical protein
MADVIHSFKDDLATAASGNSNKPPRSISAKDLDGNFKAVTVIAPKDNSYTVDMSDQGTTLNIFPATPGSGTFVLGMVGGKIKWIQTQDCDKPAS